VPPPRFGFLEPFHGRDFRLLWSGAFLSSLGTWTQDVALAWLIHTSMGDPVWLGLRTLSGELPLIAFMLVGGAAADRIDRRRILLGSQVVQMTMAALLAVLYFTDRLGIWWILGAAFVTGLAQSQSAPTYQATITSIVPAPQIPKAVALNSLQFNLSRFLGPALAGVLLARFGAGACLSVNAVSFLAVMLAIMAIRLPAAAPTSETLRESVKSGIRHLWADPLLRLLTFLAFAGSFLAFPLTTFLPVLADDVLKTGAAGYSMLLSSFGVGAIVGAIATAQRGHVAGRGRILLVSYAVYGACAVGALLCGRQPVAMAFLAVCGFSLVNAFSTVNSLVQEHAPAEMRGRVLSIWGLAFRSGMPVGSVMVGAAARIVPVTAILAATSAVLGVLALTLLVRSRRLRAV
jgi:MFS family permease